MDEPAKACAITRLSPAMCAVDTENTAWLKRQVAANGWYRSSRDGAKVAAAAWLLVQHADRDPAFQEQVLKLMAELLPSAEVSASNYAYLFDRVAVAAHRPQRYGTQGRCMAGSWEPLPLEKPDEIDSLRQAVGLGSLENYKAMFKGMCPAF